MMVKKKTFFFKKDGSKIVAYFVEAIEQSQSQQAPSGTVKISITCPVCGGLYDIHVPADILTSKKASGGITAILVQAPCKHAFIMYIDANGKVRGYQKIDASSTEAGFKISRKEQIKVPPRAEPALPEPDEVVNFSMLIEAVTSLIQARLVKSGGNA